MSHRRVEKVRSAVAVVTGIESKMFNNLDTSLSILLQAGTAFITSHMVLIRELRKFLSCPEAFAIVFLIDPSVYPSH